MSTQRLFAIDLADYQNSSLPMFWETRVSGIRVAENRVVHPTRSLAVFSHSQLSAWSSSAWKRLFDFLCVSCALPFLIPIMLLVAAAVCVTSAGPALFLQKRMGRDGHVFTIMKFRTMMHREHSGQVVTTASDQRLTSIGSFLRHWKLDELPQVLNVLSGQMSLVGPRPKVPEHEPEGLPCRPGITGAATIVFACEERVLVRIPRGDLNSFYSTVVLPTKRQLDAEYLKRATFISDLKLIVNSVFGRWDSNLMESLVRFGGRDEQARRSASQTIADWVIPQLVPSSIRVRKDVPSSAD